MSKLCQRNEGVSEVAIPSDKPFENYCKCQACESVFPMVGDTDEWKCPREEKLLENYGMGDFFLEKMLTPEEEKELAKKSAIILAKLALQDREAARTIGHMIDQLMLRLTIILAKLALQDREAARTIGHMIDQLMLRLETCKECPICQYVGELTSAQISDVETMLRSS